jgi:hypothetical protein
MVSETLGFFFFNRRLKTIALHQSVLFPMLFPKRGAGTGPRGSNSFAGKGDSAAARKKVPELNDFIEKRGKPA